MSFNFFLADRIKELSRTENTSNIVLDGAVNGFSSFGDFFASGDTVFYAITDNTKYEVGSGQYLPVGSDRTLSRYVIRSSNLNSGPYNVYGSGSSGGGTGQEGYFHPVYLTKTSALSGVDIPTGPFDGVTEHTLSGYPGVTFYMPSTHQGIAESSHPAISGVSYNASGAPVDFDPGIKEVFVTYPGKTAVFNGYGLDSDINEPKESGLAFWKNEQIINYTSLIVLDDDNNFLGIRQSAPNYALDIGGDPSYSIINVSGLIEGGSGIMFSGGGALSDHGFVASGGRQIEPFFRNRKGTAANGIIHLSGMVHEVIDFDNQAPKLVFAGPQHDCGCTDAAPTFRLLTPEDLPLAGSDGLDNQYVRQDNAGSSSSDPFPFIAGQVALYKSSGTISYSSGIIYDVTNERLGLGGTTVGQIDPAHTLDVSGTLAATSGYFNQLIFTDSLIDIGTNVGNNAGSIYNNFYNININDLAGYNSSGMFDTICIGREAASHAMNASGTTAIGYNSLFKSRFIYDSVFMGHYAGYNASGLTGSVVLGSGAGSGIALDDFGVLLGSYAGAETSGTSNSVGIGYKALYSSSGDILNLYAIGSSAGSEASGAINHSIAIGTSAGQYIKEVSNLNALGKNAAFKVSGADDSNVIGTQAGYQASGLKYIDAFGFQSASGAMLLKYTPAIGFQSASSASGSYNIYVGHNAGIGASGHENIEIIASGASSSFLTHEASGKINIGNTIVGDIYESRVAVGAVENASPSGTLYVRPRNADEPAFIIRHQGSGSRTPYFMLQSGDAQTFYHITNSGDVVHSGYLEPSGGVSLPPITPANWMNVTTNRLYNDAGTLKWNGSPVSVGGGMASFDLRAKIASVNNNADSGVSISNAQTILFSGSHGVVTQIDSGNRKITIDPSILSGVLQNQISASTYSFKTAVSGLTQAAGGGASNNLINTQGNNSSVVLSGVSGIKIDYAIRNDGTNNSGIFSIGWDSSSTYNFKVRSDINDVAGAEDTIAAAQTVVFSGASGIITRWDATDNTLRIGASGLHNKIDSSGEYLNSQILEAHLSGVAISGIAVWSSGEFARKGLGAEGTSGILFQNEYALDPNGSGRLARLYISDSDNSYQTIRITTGLNEDNTPDLGVPANQTQLSGIYVGKTAGHRTQTEATLQENIVAIGTRAASGLKNDHLNSIYIGQGAGSSASSTSDSPSDSNIGIGTTALSLSTKVSNTVALGYQPAVSMTHSNNCTLIGIGVAGGFGASGVNNTVAIGSLAMSSLESFQKKASYIDNCVYIGHETAQDIHRDGASVGIGYRSSYRSFKSPTGVRIGAHAGQNNSGINFGVHIGYNAGLEQKSSSDGTTIGHPVTIGLEAGAYSADNDNVVAIGRGAGEAASGTAHSVLLGSYAGFYRKGDNAIIISNRSLKPNTVGDPWCCAWADQTDDYVLDIGETIQGRTQSNNKHIHIGRSLLDKGDAGVADIRVSPSPDEWGYIEGSTLNIATSHHADTVLRLAPHQTNVQTAPMMVAVHDLATLSDPGNDIINKKGYLVAPVADGVTSAGASTQLFRDSAKNYEIPKEIGTMAIDGGGSWVAFVVDDPVLGVVWKKANLSSF